jgi:predicted DNA binding CopG/RHH family protein
MLVIAKMVKVSLDLEESLHKAIRKRAIDKGITMKAYIVELIEKGISIEESEVMEGTNEE